MDFHKHLFDFSFCGKKIFQKKIIKLEGGEQYSQTLRYYINKKYNVDVGMYSYGGVFAPDFNIGGKVTVGNYCSFASGICYYGANHPYHYASMSPFFYNSSFGFNVKDVERHQLTIGNDVWIGYRVIITCNCHSIGNGAVIGAGSIITKDIPPYAIVAGTPAKILRYRFDEDTIKTLEKSKWWNYSPEQLMQYYNLISHPKEWAKMIMNINNT